jgi:hypothetical protein
MNRRGLLIGLLGLTTSACTATAQTDGSAPPTPPVQPPPTTELDILRKDATELRRLFTRVRELYPSSPAANVDAQIELTAIGEVVSTLLATYTANGLNTTRPLSPYYGVRHNLYNACSNLSGAIASTRYGLQMLYPPANVRRKPTPSDISTSRQDIESTVRHTDTYLTLAEKEIQP